MPETENAQRDIALRVAQSVAVVRQMPMVLFGNGGSCLIACLAMQPYYSWGKMTPLIVVIGLLLLPVTWNWWRLRRRPVPATVSRKRIVKLTVYSGLLGHWWGLMMLAYLPDLPHEVSAYIVMGAGFLCAGAAGILYVIPLACVLYSLPMLGAGIWVAATSGAPSALPVTLFLMLMGLGVVWMLQANWKSFHTLFVVSNEKTQLLEAAAQADALKSEFLENMSHEIRNPLASVIGYANLLRESEGRIPLELREYVRNVVTGGESLKVLLNDILDMAKLDAKNITLTPVPFEPREMLKDAMSLVMLSAQTKKLRLDVQVAPDLPGWLVADPFRLRQVLLNLMGNAIKFTARGRIDVRATWMGASADDMAGLLVMEVSDTGPGIPEATRCMLFQRFSRINESQPACPEGAGLGLAICQGLLVLMGGRIALTSRPGYGTSFTIEVPVVRCAPPRSQESGFAALAAAASKRLHVLVVDDMQPNRELLQAQLHALGHSVDEASTGMQAVTLCMSELYDVILMDIDMPGVDGLMATRLLRSRCPLNFLTPVIAVTGHVASSHLEDFKAAGMDDHLVKPVSATALGTKVNVWSTRDADCLSPRGGGASSS